MQGTQFMELHVLPISSVDRCVGDPCIDSGYAWSANQTAAYDE